MKKRKDGLYRVRETIEINGIKKQYEFYGKTKAEIKAKRDALLLSHDVSSFTFEKVYKMFKEIEEVRIGYAAFKTKCERIEAFHSVFPCKLTSITPQMIAVDLNALALKNPRTGKPTAKRTLSRYLHALSNVFEFAEANRYTTYNPCKYVKVPSDAPQTSREALSPDEYKTILASKDKRFLAAKMAILLGLRRGELAALTFGDIDLVNHTVHVDKAWDYKSNKLKGPKSKAGIRSVPLPLALLQPIGEAKFGHDDSELVLSKNGAVLNEYEWQQLQEYITAQSGVSFSWHQLRHTYATILYDSGTGVLEAQRFLGHSDVKVTLGIYTHLSEKTKNAAASKIDAFLA